MSEPSRNRRLNGWGEVFLAVLGILVGVLALAYVVVRAPSKPPTAFISPNRIVLQFGLSREALTRSSRFDVCSSTSAADFLECRKSDHTSSPTTATTVPPARPSIVAAGLQSDLADGQRQFPANQVTVTAVNVGSRGILVNMTANPLEPTRVLSGNYKGRAIIDRNDGNQIPIEVEIGLAKRTGAVTGWVLFALVLGALGGALIKWLDDSFGPIAALRRRQRRVENFLRLRQQGKSPPRLPVGVLRRLDDVRLAIKSFDAEGVADTLQRITSNQDALIKFDRGLEALGGEIATQKSLLDGGIGTAAVRGAIAMEAAKVEELRSRVWPWEKAERVIEELGQAEQEFRTLTVAMRRARYDPKQIEVVEKLALKRMSEETAAIEELLQTTVPAQSTSAATYQSTVDSTPAPDINHDMDIRGADIPLQEYSPDKRRSLGLWLLDNAWWLTLFVVALFVVFVGYQTQFLDDPGFQGDLTDYIQLAAWALAIQVAGGTIIDTAGKLRTSRSSS